MNRTPPFWKVIAAIFLVLIMGLTLPRGHILSKNTQTKILISSLETACLNYVTEYGVLPASSENHVLVDILLATNEKKDSAEWNPRAIAFFDSSLEKNLTPKKEIIDTWGNPLRILFHPDRGVSVISAGKDCIFYTADDINSWK